MIKHVDRYTRAPLEGRMIYCPNCGNGKLAYHFAWSGATCQHCWQLVDKGDYLLEPPDKAVLPKPLPPVFRVSPDNDMEFTLYTGEGLETDIYVRGSRVCWAFDRFKDCEHPAAAKTYAMELYKGRKSA